MHDASDLFKQFQHFRKAGIDAYLNLQCHGGQLWVNLQVSLPHPPPFPQQHQHHRHHARQHGPRNGSARLRRRARRAEARERAAEINAASKPTTEEVSVQTNLANISVDAAVQAESCDMLPCPNYFSPYPHPPDEVCPDEIFEAAAVQTGHAQSLLPPHQPGIPQVDGASGIPEQVNDDAAAITKEQFVDLIKSASRQRELERKTERENEME